MRDRHGSQQLILKAKPNSIKKKKKELYTRRSVQSLSQHAIRSDHMPGGDAQHKLVSSVFMWTDWDFLFVTTTTRSLLSTTTELSPLWWKAFRDYSANTFKEKATRAVSTFLGLLLSKQGCFTFASALILQSKISKITYSHRASLSTFIVLRVTKRQ